MKTIGIFSNKPLAIRNNWINKNVASAELAQIVEKYLAEGGNVQKCKAAKYRDLNPKRGNAVLGPTTQGREGLYGGLRHVYSK